MGESVHAQLVSSLRKGQRDLIGRDSINVVNRGALESIVIDEPRRSVGKSGERVVGGHLGIIRLYCGRLGMNHQSL